MALFGFKKKASDNKVEDEPASSNEHLETEDDNVEDNNKPGMLSRLRSRLAKTRTGFADGLASLLLGKKTIDQDLLDELEMQLLTADIGIDLTDRILKELTERLKRKQLDDPEALYRILKEQLAAVLKPVDQPLLIPEQDSPFVILMVGINGAGKTTTIGKLARKFKAEGKSVMLAAGDTFRAAAVEQLQVWGERNAIPVVAQHTGADSASVLYDALESARAKGIDVLIADTAGRLHTQSNLMEELKKVKRVMGKLDAKAPHEVMLVVDAGTGQNALSQGVEFNETVGLTGITLTKLDGTAKGGTLFAIADRLNVPIRFIGVGEGVEDLRPFNSEEFVDALFGE